MLTIPEDCVAVEIIVKRDGSFETKVVGHGVKAFCSTGADGDDEDRDILKELEQEIGEADDHGHTDEYYQDRAPIVTHKPRAQEAPQVKQGNGGKTMDMNFGV